MASLVRKGITLAVQKAGYYSVLADETKDMSKQEQMSIVLRCVDVQTALVTERFLTFVPAMSLNAESLCKYILDTLNQFDIDPRCMVSQGYDGASVMSGHCSGVNKESRKLLLMLYTYTVKLNLVLVDCVKNNSFAFNFFSLLETLYVFMSTSKAHVVFVEKQSSRQVHKRVEKAIRYPLGLQIFNS